MLFQKRASIDDSVEMTRQHSYDSFQSGSICKICNRGWMGTLEAAVAPWILSVQAKQDLQRFQED